MTTLGIDLGTSGLRALLVSDDGTPLGSVERSFTVQRPHPGWSEQDPRQWVDALDDAVAELSARYPAFADLTGIGVAGHMHGATLLDEAGSVLRPCILWNDTRSAVQAARLDATPHVRDLSGNMVFPGFTAPKLAWVAEHEPDIFASVSMVLLPSGYMNFHLTGEAVADMSDSAGTSWLDVGARDWSDRLLDAGGMRRDQMPRLVEGSQQAGVLRSELARRWGVGEHVIVAGGAGDNAAAACGIGALRDGQGFVSLGTSGVLLMARDEYRPDAASAVHTFCHAVPDRWYQMGVILSATDSLNWLSRVTGARPAELASALGETLRAPGPELFVPYLSGERTPHNDAAARGVFTGLGAATGREDMTRAVLEGVSFALRDCAEALAGTGARAEWLFAIGGGAQSLYWLRLLATVLDTPLAVPASGEFGAALGAARLARLAVTGEAPDDVIVPPEAGQLIEPDKALRGAFDETYARYRATYPAIRDIGSGYA
ncbi:xylulokinase [Paracoccus sp. TK19116]|uniref:Xylulose kinase n=1 Tax=Paracoccus albicereus TaxID=2922394 RepID=A0ABT1MQ62_9RHOB|nr:xylulokinase [Paracoccus albicereus]MCQ0970427.1 xylulokinase [Paracoccus albicereus]